jgi:hypothetical protein
VSLLALSTVEALRVDLTISGTFVEWGGIHFILKFPSQAAIRLIGGVALPMDVPRNKILSPRNLCRQTDTNHLSKRILTLLIFIQPSFRDEIYYQQTALYS